MSTPDTPSNTRASAAAPSAAAPSAAKRTSRGKGTPHKAARTTTKRTTAAKRTSHDKPSTATTARRATASTAKRSTATTKSVAARQGAPLGTVGIYAERSILIPVGAALIARDRLIAGVGELPRNPSKASAKAQAQLRRFERRGTSVRNSLEREARRTRVRLERELRRRRRSVDHAVNNLEGRRSSLSRTVTGQLEEASHQIERTVQARAKAAGSLAGKVQERIKELV